MKKENDISQFGFLDFYAFVLPDNKTELLNIANSAQKEILVVFFNDKNDPELELLLKNIFSAVNKDPEKDIFFLKATPQTSYSFNEIRKKIPVKDLVFFGVPLSGFGLNLNIPPYQPLLVNNFRILFADSLEKVNTDVNKKKALWSCLKEMYLKK